MAWLSGTHQQKCPHINDIPATRFYWRQDSKLPCKCTYIFSLHDNERPCLTVMYFLQHFKTFSFCQRVMWKARSSVTLCCSHKILLQMAPLLSCSTQLLAPQKQCSVWGTWRKFRLFMSYVFCACTESFQQQMCIYLSFMHMQLMEQWLWQVPVLTALSALSQNPKSHCLVVASLLVFFFFFFFLLTNNPYFQNAVLIFIILWKQIQKSPNNKYVRWGWGVIADPQSDGQGRKLSTEKRSYLDQGMTER